MTSQPGSLVLLKVGDGGAPETFTPVGGLVLTSFIHRNEGIDATTLDSGAWHELLEGAGMRTVSISGSGRFTDSAAEEAVRANAMNASIRNYRITFGNGDVLSGKFQIMSYQRGGANGNIEVYSLSLASSGPITFTPAP
jgi:TP901-1 family phage major tail protein